MLQLLACTLTLLTCTAAVLCWTESQCSVDVIFSMPIKIQIVIRITRTSSYLPISEHLEESAETAACVNAHLCLVAKMMQMQIITTQHTKASMQKQQRLDWDLAMLWSARVQQVEWDARAVHWLFECRGGEEARDWVALGTKQKRDGCLTSYTYLREYK